MATLETQRPQSPPQVPSQRPTQQHQHRHLRSVAEAARADLAHLRLEYRNLARRAASLSESMRLLQGVLDAWERVAPAPLFSLAPQAEEPFSLDPPAYPSAYPPSYAPASPPAPGKAPDAASARPGLASISPFPLPAAWPYGEVAGVPRAEVMERVHGVLAEGSPLSVAQVHAAIEARYKVFDSVSAVAMAMRHGVVGGRYDYDGRSGHYRVTSAA